LPTEMRAVVGSLPVEDHIEILNLYSRYNHTIDSVELDLWTDCFVENGALAVPSADLVYTGPSELQEFGARYMSRNGGRERHISSNVEVWADKEGARGRAYLLMSLGGSRKSPPTFVMSGRYEDTLRKTAEGWRFLRRVLTYDTP
jgi:hypothetical protein